MVSQNNIQMYRMIMIGMVKQEGQQRHQRIWMMTRIMWIR